MSSRYSRGDVGDARNVKDVAANAAFEALKRMVDECDAFEGRVGVVDGRYFRSHDSLV